MIKERKVCGPIQETCNEMRQIMDGRSEPLKKIEIDVVQLNVTGSVLTDNKEHHIISKEVDCAGKINHFLMFSNVSPYNIMDNRKLRRKHTICRGCVR